MNPHIIHVVMHRELGVIIQSPEARRQHNQSLCLKDGFSVHTFNP